ncbi:MAG: DUF374 domain-containing protein [Myxococcales bacterium]|nr:DUF374 domain-containing protein [Myxococcales bacterium]
MMDPDAAAEITRNESGRPRSDGRGPLVRLGLRLLGIGLALLLRLLGATWRIEVLGHDPRARVVPGQAPRPHLAALFHESMIPCAWLFRDAGYRVAVSRSRDGDLVREVLVALGYADPVRGSSSRGASAVLLGLLRGLEAGCTSAVLVDGPRGPARESKPGIVALSARTGLPIQPIAVSARPALRLSSWDRTLVPLPFARVVCAYGEPFTVDLGAPRAPDAEQAFTNRLDAALGRLHHEADAVLLPR